MEVREPAAKYGHLFGSADELRSPDGEIDSSCRSGEWREVSFDEAFSFSGGLSASRAQLGRRGHLYLHYGDIHSAKGSFVDLSRDRETIPRLDVSLVEVPTASLLEDGDVVFVDASEDAEGASKHVVVLNPAQVPFIAGLHTIVAKRKDEALLPIFAGYCFQSDELKRQFQFFAAGTKVLGVSKTNIRKIRFRIPPPLEQKGIGDALFHVDSLIESLEKLLVKKRQIKEGAMQELLTGTRRLPGFVGDWTKQCMSELGSVFGGLTGKAKRHFGQGNARYITFMNVVANVVIDLSLLDRVDVAQGERQNHVQKGDLLFNGSSETPEEVGLSAYLDTEVVDVFLNSFCFGFRAHVGSQFNRLYLAYYFRSSAGRELLRTLAQGATRYNLSKKAFMRLELPWPSPAEQDAIAGALSDMDAEITALEARLAKTRQLKQGMMQVLLTGAIRLT